MKQTKTIQRLSKKKFLEYYYSKDRTMNNVEQYLDYALRHFEDFPEAASYIAEWLYYIFYRAKFVNGKIRTTDINDIIANAWMAITIQLRRGNYKKKTKPSSWLLTILRITAQNFIKTEYYSSSELDDWAEEQDHEPIYFDDIGAERLITMGEDENMILSFKEGEEFVQNKQSSNSEFFGLKYYLLATLNKNLKPYLENILKKSLEIEFNDIINNFFNEHMNTLNLYVASKLQLTNKLKKDQKRVRNKKSYRQFFLLYVLSSLPANVKNDIYTYLANNQISLKVFIQRLEQLCFAREDLFLSLKNKLINKIEDETVALQLVKEILETFPFLTIHNLQRYKYKVQNFIKGKGYDIVLWKNL